MTKPLPKDAPRKRRGGLAAAIRELDAQGKSPLEIQRRLGCTRDAVWNTLHRASARDSRKGDTEHWQGPTYGPTCQEWVITPDGLRHCGAEKYQIDGHVMGQCKAHYEAQRPTAGKIRSIA